MSGPKEGDGRAHPDILGAIEIFTQGRWVVIAPDTEIARLQAENARLRDLLDNALGWLDDKEHDKPLLSVDSIRADRAAMGESDD